MRAANAFWIPGMTFRRSVFRSTRFRSSAACRTIVSKPVRVSRRSSPAMISAASKPPPASSTAGERMSLKRSPSPLRFGQSFEGNRPRRVEGVFRPIYKSSRPGRAVRKFPRLQLAGALFLTVLNLSAPAQQCTASGGTISTPETAACTISTAGSTVTVASPATFTGWMNFTGNNTSLTVNPGASIIGSAAPGPQNLVIGVSSPASVWSMINDGNVQVGANVFGMDAVAFNSAGTYTIANTGILENTISGNAGANAIETRVNGTNLTVTNSGTISTSTGATFSLTGTGGPVTITNQATGVIQSTSNRAVESNATLTITNSGVIRTLANDLAVNSTGLTTVRNAGAISAAGGAAQAAMVFGANADTLILEPTSSITGFVDAGGGTDTLILGGNSGSGSISLSQISGSQQYRGFETFEKRENSAWTLTSA